MLKDTLKTENIGRRTTIDLSKELYDTRIPPFESRIFDYQVKPVIGAGRIVYSESLPLPTGNGGGGMGLIFITREWRKTRKMLP